MAVLAVRTGRIFEKQRGEIMRSEFNSNIDTIRAVEDCIRVTHKYTEGLGTIRKPHDFQGEQFPSKSFTRNYEVYPDMVVGMDMPVSDAIDWLWADTTCISVRFWYNYLNGRASFKVLGGEESLRRLVQSIPVLLRLLQAIATGDEAKRLDELSKTTAEIVEPADMDDEEEKQEPRTGLLDRLIPSRKRTR